MAEFREDRRRLIGGGVILAGAGLVAGYSSGAKGESTTAASGWAPAPESIDSWLDKPGTRHRMAFDSISGEGGANALEFANNFLHVNEADYGLKPEQVGVVVIFRHMSTPYGYNNSIWAKYGKKFAEQMKLDPDSAIRAVTMNPVLTADPTSPPPKGMEWAGDGNLTALAPKGVRFAVCGLATTGIAMQLAGKSGDPKAIETELKSNLVPGALIVPAGISTVNRAQEHGYSLAYIG